MLAAGSGVVAGDPDWLVRETSGTVRILPAMDPDDNWSRIKIGDLVGVMTFLKTGRKGTAILVQANSRIQLSSGTELEFPASDPHQGRDIYQTSGRATYTISGPDPVRIVTPWLVSTATWGTVTVTVENGFATVEAHHGEPIVVSRFTGRATVLDPDQMVRVDGRTETLFQAAVEQAAHRPVLD
jgi:hypothetical protein